MKEEWIELAGLRAVSVGERETARVVMVLLHGFQMEPADLAPFAHSLNADAWMIFPEGPLPAQPRGRAWWHIDHLLRDEALKKGPRDFAPQHPPDLPSGRDRLRALVAELRPQIGARPFVLGGFSQGGMLTCDTVLRSDFSLSAMALLSASRIGADEWESLATNGRVRELPVLVSHGERDADLSFTAGSALRDFLVAAGADVTWVPFPDGHEIPLVVWRRLKKLLQSL